MAMHELASHTPTAAARGKTSKQKAAQTTVIDVTANRMSQLEGLSTPHPGAPGVVAHPLYGIKPISNGDFVVRVRKGYKHTAIDALAKALSLSQEQVINQLNLPRSTIKRQQSEGRAFSPDHSDRMYRAQKLIDISTETFGDKADAVRWLLREHPALGGVSALSLVDTTAGYERVRDELERITHGVPV